MGKGMGMGKEMGKSALPTVNTLASQHPLVKTKEEG